MSPTLKESRFLDAAATPIFSPREYPGTPWKPLLSSRFPCWWQYAQQLYPPRRGGGGAQCGGPCPASVGSAGPFDVHDCAVCGQFPPARLWCPQALAQRPGKAVHRIGTHHPDRHSAASSMVLGTLLARPVLQTRIPRPEIIEDAIPYPDLICGIAGLTSTTSFPASSGLGTASPPGFLLLTSGLNIALDLLFVIVWLGRARVAIATVISQMVSRRCAT